MRRVDLCCNYMSNATDKNVFQPEMVFSSEMSFEEFYREHWSELYLFAYNILRDQDLSKDVVQEVFIPLINSEKRKEINYIRPYLMQSVKYQVYKLVRSEKARLKAFEKLDFSDCDNNTEELLLGKETGQQIALSVNNLPDKCRTIFSLKQDGHTAKTIAAMTGLSQRTVEHQLYIAVKKLRCSLQDIISLALFLSCFLLP